MDDVFVRPKPHTMDDVWFYVESVRAGRRGANKFEKLAVERFCKDMKRTDDFEFKIKEVEKVFKFFDLLYLTKGIGANSRFFLEGWQAFIVVNLFGFYWKKSGLRRFKYSHVEVARKNGKSTLSAAIALLMFIIEREAAPEIYTAATKKDQAKIVWNEARRMITKSPALSKSKKLRLLQHHIFNSENDGVFEALANDSKTLDGLSPFCVIVDEIHEHKNRSLYDVLKSGTGARENPIISTITTAGMTRESFAYRHRKMCCEILEEIKVDESQFAIIFTLDEDDDWEDSKLWGKANPNLHVSVRAEYLEQEYTQAKNASTGRVGFITKHLNVWTDAAQIWIPSEVWSSAPTSDVEALVGLDCYIGLDLAATSDVTAMVLAFPLEDKIQLVPYFWLPSDNIKLSDSYQAWVDGGYLLTTEGNVTDYNFIKKTIYELGEKYNIQAIAYDPWNSSQLIIDLNNEAPDICTPFRQGFKSMSAPMKELERLSLSHKIIHNNNPVLTWMMQNVEVKYDPAGNIKPTKELNAQKIDGVVAAIMALGEVMNDRVEEGEAFDYEWV